MLSGEENIDAYLLLLLIWLSAIVLIAFGTSVKTQDLRIIPYKRNKAWPGTNDDNLKNVWCRKYNLYTLISLNLVSSLARKYFKVPWRTFQNVGRNIMQLSIFYYSKWFRFKGSFAQIHCEVRNPRMHCNKVSEIFNPRWQANQKMQSIDKNI